jgi:hypothetical protein
MSLNCSLAIFPVRPADMGEWLYEKKIAGVPLQEQKTKIRQGFGISQ